MSYGEEPMVEMLIQSELEKWEREYNINRLWGAIGAKVWITADNASLNIVKMHTSHIHNCAAMLRRNLPYYDNQFSAIARSYIALFESELQNRYPPKDAAEGFFDEEEDEFIERSSL